MLSKNITFNNIVDIIYSLPLDERLELITLLEHNIADARRHEILFNYKTAQDEKSSGKLKFSSNIDELKKML